jgi:outer membrane protein assembly factor BamB
MTDRRSSETRTRYIALLMLSLAVAAAAAGADPADMGPAIEVRVDQRVELVAILFRMAGRDEYHMTQVARWERAVDEYFAAYREHPAVTMTEKLAGPYNVGFFVPMNLAVHLTDPPELAVRSPLGESPSIHRTWTTKPEITEEYLASVRQFARDTHFEDFMEQQAEIVDETERRLQRLVERDVEREWFDRFWGTAPEASFVLVPGLVNGLASYGVQYREPDGRRELYAIAGVVETDDDELPTFGPGFVTTVVHELNHPYADPQVTGWLERLGPAAEELYEANVEVLRPQAIGSAESLLHESLVRAAVARYRLRTEGPEAMEAEVAEQVELGFSWMPGLVELFGEYEADRAAYPTMAGFMPRVVAFFETAGAADGKRPVEPSEALGNWPQWRGPLGTGVAPDADPPLEWSETRNVRWKTPIPGRGHSSPVVWGQRIFLTSAVPVGKTLSPQGGHAHGAHDNVSPTRRLAFTVLAVDRGDGSIVWQRTVREEQPHDATHASGSWASASPVTDGEVVVASFGSSGVHALTVSGEPLWSVDLGKMNVKHSHGEGSSPALAGETVVVNWDHEGESFVVALDRLTGKEKWRVAREEGTSWSSPLVVRHAGKTQVVIAATNRVRGYELDTGKTIWECGGLSGNVVATPVAADGIVYVANSYDTREMLAIRLDDAKGDVTDGEAVVWTRKRDTPYVPSPVLLDGALCFLKHYQGVLTCVDASTGETRSGPARLPEIGNVYASPVGAAGRIYVFDLDGSAVVLRNGERLDVLARNRLDDAFAASPALVGDELILRGERHLYRIERTTASD